MKKHVSTLAWMALVAASSASSALAGQTFVETFTGGSNQGGWTYGLANEVIETSGGNPGAYLHEPSVDTYAPQPHTALGVSSVFTGDYRAHRVESFGVDVIVFSAQFFTSPPLTLMLANDNGTPNDTSDDCIVYLVGATVASPGAGWVSYEFPIPSQSTTLPPGWATYNACSTPDASWNNVITHVSYVRFLYGDPTFFYPIGPWNTGIDNPRITIELGTAYCFGDGSGTPCPCNNDSTGSVGCKNSTGSGASLDASGSASVSANDLALIATGMPPHVSVFLFQGTAEVNGGTGAMLGDGLLCAGGTLKRFPVHSADASGSATWGPGLAAFGGWTAGATFNFQAWYRNNAGPCGSGFNLSSARSITFSP
jgi:hypothetical protein